MNDLRVSAAGDSALIVEFGAPVRSLALDAESNARAIALASRLEAQQIDGVLDIVPALRSLGIHFDPLRISVEQLTTIARTTAEHAETTTATHTGRLHRIPVCYGGKFGPDLGEVAALAGLSEQEVIAAHAGSTYSVLMLGFTAGFAYLGPVAASLVVPRRATPRSSVPGGSVAIAGYQTGIYPSGTPGGWRVIGRTWIRLFEPDRTDPFLLAPGDRVEFVPVAAAEYTEYGEAAR